MVRAAVLLLAAVTVAADDECCTCLTNGGGAGCADRCTGQSDACKSCVEYGGGAGCIDDGRCSCGSSGSYCTSDMSNLASRAQSDSAGKRPDGRCYAHVANDYIDKVGYGGICVGCFASSIPSDYWAEAHQFADYLNAGSHAADLKLANIQSSVANNPYNAPEGSIVVVRAGTPGTAHPTAGDIAVKGSGDSFYNGGEMGYGGSGNFPPSNDFVLGIFVPLQCHTSLALNMTSHVMV